MARDPAIAGRHLRLFELIRQRNLAQAMARRPVSAAQPSPAEAQLFRLAAEQSLAG